ncbi:hypothetical protein BVG19_g166 [[Candida] boidinii]|nr:hypothetical protein BVG19_g166 [[Candida] boidinii]OWB49734.1 hypothetical protein B5S27_g1276 [[Candida] boidinii]
MASTIAITESELKSLKDLKGRILGNDTEKNKLINDKSAFNSILEILSFDAPSNADFSIFNNLQREAAIILQSFSFDKNHLDTLMSDSLLLTLISSTIKNPSVLAEINLKTLINIRSLTPESSLDLSIYKNEDRFIETLYNILNNGGSSTELCFDTCVLIPFIKSTHLPKLYKPIVKRFSIINSYIFRQALFHNNTTENMSNYENCQNDTLSPLPPSTTTIDTYSSDIAPMLYALAHLIEVIYLEKGNIISLPKPMYYTLTSLINSSNLNVKLSSINLLTHYTIYHLSPGKRHINFMKIVPSLVSIIEKSKSLKSNQDILLSSSYKLSRKMSPLYLLSKITECDESINHYLVNTDAIELIASIITDNYNPKEKFLSENLLYKISDCLLILSCIASSIEEYRSQITKYNISPIIVDSLLKHFTIYNELQEIKSNGVYNISSPKTELLLRLSNRITLFSAYLLRSLSRSTALLRTYLVDLNIVEILLNCLRVPQGVVECFSEELQGSEILLKTVVLGIISNLILDFSAVKNDLLSSEVSALFSSFIDKDQPDILRLNSLILFRNSLFGDDIKYKENFIQILPFDKIFELCYDANPQIKEQSFNILRNLSVGRKNYANEIIASFPACKTAKLKGDYNFLDFLLNNLKQPHNEPSLIVSINYILVHLAASNAKNKALMMCNIPLIGKILEQILSRDGVHSNKKTIDSHSYNYINNNSNTNNKINNSSSSYNIKSNIHNHEKNNDNRNKSFVPTYDRRITVCPSNSSFRSPEEQYNDYWKIKLSCLWIVINLTWKEEITDRRVRRTELRRQGPEIHSFVPERSSLPITSMVSDVSSTGQSRDIIANSMSINAANTGGRENDPAHDSLESTSDIRPDDMMDLDVSKDENTFSDYLSARMRALKLLDLGFYTAIKALNNECEIMDFKERARTAVFQMVLYESKG